ncbi:hypothetical protein B0J12DRAFT_603796 [Macrophomina phaseolina]|uniref:Enoyl reductase (ER) domain-containing protein n=1 Tax=Macrophomina phaseolina TaxID=35725 RepID=A0ABQ8G737_9PEZI|nr:hypothetical protein B0J12DRAFT_603796 [Macrophomina phaseolina]
MADTSTPPTMKAWQSHGVTTTLEASLTFNTTLPTPTTSALGPNQLLIRVLSAGLNPADYKFAELGAVSKLSTFRGGPYIPGMDFAGRIVGAHASVTDPAYRAGALVFGCHPPQPKPRYGALCEYTVASTETCVPLPEGVGVDAAAAAGCAGLSALTTLQGLGPGQSVLVLGGSGGVGTFTVQVAKRGLQAAHVTATCSGANADLVRGLGADEVLDYRTVDVVEELKAGGRMYDLVVDNVGDPRQRVYEEAASFLKKGGVYMQIGADTSFAGLKKVAARAVCPSFLGGGKRKFKFVTASVKLDYLKSLAEWMREGKLKPVIDRVYELEDVPEALGKLRQGRTRGKIVVRVSKET